MRTSLSEIKEAEDFLLKKMSIQDLLVYKSRLILNPLLQWQVSCQEKLYRVIRLHGRNALKKEIADIHTKTFNDPARAVLQNRIRVLFQKP